MKFTQLVRGPGTITTVSAPMAISAGSRVRRMARFVRGNAALVTGLVLVIGIVATAMLLPLPHDPLRPSVDALTQPPSALHPFGTDAQGFDVFSRTIVAALRDIPVAVAGTLLAVLFGVPLGIFAAYSGRIGESSMRLVDAFGALPMIVLAIVAVQLIGSGLQNIVLAIAVVNIPRVMRLTRGETLAVRSTRYVEAAVASGCSPVRIAFNHILRNAYGAILVQATLTAANAVIMIASLGFLGIGIEPPEPTWGGMIKEGVSSLIQGRWWVVVFPSIGIFLAVTAFNLIAEGIEKWSEGRGRA